MSKAICDKCQSSGYGIDRSCIFADKWKDYCKFHKCKVTDCTDCYDYENYYDDYKPNFNDEWGSI